MACTTPEQNYTMFFNLTLKCWNIKLFIAVPQDYILAHSFTPVTSNPWPATHLWCTSVLPTASRIVQTYLTYMSPPQNVGGLFSNFVYSAHMVKFCKQYLSGNRIGACCRAKCMLQILQWKEQEKYEVVSSTILLTISVLSTFW